MVRRGVSLLVVFLLGVSILTQGKIIEEPQYQDKIHPVKQHETSYASYEPFNITSDADFETEAWLGNESLSNPYLIESLNITTNNSTCI